VRGRLRGETYECSVSQQRLKPGKSWPPRENSKLKRGGDRAKCMAYFRLNTKGLIQNRPLHGNALYEKTLEGEHVFREPVRAEGRRCGEKGVGRASQTGEREAADVREMDKGEETQRSQVNWGR